MSDTCASFREELVDYADGELAPTVAQGVAAHLAGCAACRRELAAIVRGLELAQTVWSESVEACEAQPTVAWQTQAANVRTRRVRLVGAAAMAASLLLAVAASGWWWRRHGHETDIVQAPPAGEAATAAPIADGHIVEGEIEIAEIERLLDREELAARLAASAQVLADQPGAEEYAQRSFRYLAEVFPNTAAGREASQRVNQ